MKISDYDGLKVLDTPFPVWYVRPFRWIYRKIMGDRAFPQMSAKATRIFLIVCGIVATFLIWAFEGFINPLELLVDIPLYDFTVYPGHYSAMHLVMVLFFSSILMSIIQLPIKHAAEYKFFSANGILLWLTGAAAGIASDSLARLLMDNVIMPHYLNTPNANLTVFNFVLGFALNGALFFVLTDSLAVLFSIYLTPLVSSYYVMLLPEGSFLATPILRQLIITFALSLLLSFIDKFGVIDKITGFCIKYLYTPRYMPKAMIFMLVIPIPFYLSYKRNHPKAS